MIIRFIKLFMKENRLCAVLSPISGNNLENIAITGEGIIDGSGDAWRPVKRSKLTSSQWNELKSSGGIINKEGNIWYPSEKSLRGNHYRIWNFSQDKSSGT